MFTCAIDQVVRILEITDEAINAITAKMEADQKNLVGRKRSVVQLDSRSTEIGREVSELHSIQYENITAHSTDKEMNAMFNYTDRMREGHVSSQTKLQDALTALSGEIEKDREYLSQVTAFREALHGRLILSGLTGESAALIEIEPPPPAMLDEKINEFKRQDALKIENDARKKSRFVPVIGLPERWVSASVADAASIAAPAPIAIKYSEEDLRRVAGAITLSTHKPAIGILQALQRSQDLKKSGSTAPSVI